MWYNVLIFLYRYSNRSRKTRWCIGKTKESIIKKFGEKIPVHKPDQNGNYFLEIELVEGTIGCFLNNECCYQSRFFSESEDIFPKDIIKELIKRNHSTGKEKLNPALFEEFDINILTKKELLLYRPYIIKRVIESGEISDFYALINEFSYAGVVDSICNEMENLSLEEIELVSKLFKFPCYPKIE